MHRIQVMVVILLAVLVVPALAIDEAVQVQFLKQLFRLQQSEWPEFMAQNRRALDATFFERVDARIRWAVDNNQIEDAMRFALVADMASKANGRTGNYRLALAYAFLKNGNVTLPAELIDNILLMDPNDKGALFLKAEMLRSQMNLFDAYQVYNQLATSGYRTAECYYQMALISLVIEQEDRAKHELEMALKADPNHEKAKAELNRILSIRETIAPPGSGNLPPLSGAANPTGTGASTAEQGQRARVFFQQAEDQLAAGDLEKAEGYYMKTIQTDPSFTKAYVYLGALYYRLGTLDAAIRYLTQATELDPNDFEAWRYLGNAYERRYDSKGTREDLDAAVAAYQKGVAISPQDKIIQGELERAQEKQGPSAQK